MEFLQRGVLLVPVLLLSLSFHEWAHAWSASRLGDDTAERLGRLTLNPLAHADLFGTILLPLLGVPFGWAKPVPVNPARFRRGVKMSTGMMITASAGPLSNFLLAAVCAVIFGLLARFAPSIIAPGQGVQELLLMSRNGTPGLIPINVSLGLFNLIPLPPLDGSRVVDGIMPLRLRPAWDQFSRIAPFILLALILLPGRPISYVLTGPFLFVTEAMLRIAEAII